MRGWRPAETLPWTLTEAPAHILLWNACDGPHLLSSLHHWPEIQEARYGKVYSHWKPFTDQPTTAQLDKARKGWR